MNKQKFLEDISDALGCEMPLSLGMSLFESGGWDSLGMLSIIALFDSYGIKLDIEKLKKINTIDELIAMLESHGA